jgi:hypothetical protein
MTSHLVSSIEEGRWNATQVHVSFERRLSLFSIHPERRIRRLPATHGDLVLQVADGCLLGSVYSEMSNNVGEY